MQQCPKSGDKVFVRFTAHFSGSHRTVTRKVGIFIRLVKHRKYINVGDRLCVLKLTGNKNNSIVRYYDTLLQNVS